MKRFYVVTREVWTQTVEVEAETQEEAIEKVARDQGNLLDDGLEYSHRMDSSTWTVDKE
jgi:hypothetical protein